MSLRTEQYKRDTTQTHVANMMEISLKTRLKTTHKLEEGDIIPRCFYVS